MKNVGKSGSLCAEELDIYSIYTQPALNRERVFLESDH
jgi:hypothetical protein